MAELTKAQLAAENATDFPNNNSGLITPAILRGFNTDMIDSTVNQTQYTADSASFSGSIAQLQSFSSSLDATFATDAQLTALSASIATTDLAQSSSIAALQVFSSSLDATFATDAQLTALSTSIAVTDLAQSASIAQLQQFSSSLDSGFVSEAEFGSYTSSNDSKVNSLIAKTGSYATTGSNSFIGNQTITGALTASTAQIAGLHYPTTDGTFSGQVLQTNAAGTLSFGNVNAVFETIRNGESTTITVGTPLYVSGALGDQPICYKANAGDATKMPVTFLAMESIAAGAAGRGITLGLITGINLTGYPVGTSLYTDGLGALTDVRPTGSNDIIQPIGIVTKTGNGGQLNVLNPGPVLLPNLKTNFTWVGDSTNQPVTRSLSNLGLALTGSSNIFASTQSFNDVVVSGTASIGFLNVTYQSSSVIFSSGSNILGDASNDTQTLWGTVKLPTGPLSVTGSARVSSNFVANKVSAFDFDTLFYGSQMGGTTANGTFFGYGSSDYQFLVGAYAGGFDNELKITTNNTGILFGDFNGSTYPTWLKLNPNSGTNPAPQFTRGLGITGSLGVTGNTTLGDATSDTTTINGSTTINGNGEATVALQIISGSVEVVGPRGNGGHFYTNLPITSSEGRINGTFVAKDLIVSGTWGGEGSGSLTVEHNTRLGTDFNTDTHIISGAVSIQGSLTANGKNIINEINNLNTFSSSVNSKSGSWDNRATTGSNTFSGTQTLTNGDLIVGANPTTGIYNGLMLDKNGLNYTIYNVSTSSAALNVAATDGIGFSYSTELLLTATPTQLTFQDFSTGDYSYKTWMTIPQNTGGNPAPQFKRGLTATGSLTITGSAVITGSVNGNVVSQSYSSNTASFNLNSGNFFNLTLPAALDQASTQLELTNLKPGQTVNVRMNLAAGVGAVTFGSNIKQVSGSIYVPSTTATTDILTFVTFDTGSAYLVAVKNLV